VPRDHLEHCGPYSITFSELNTLASCEERWFQNYVERIENDSTQAMNFGTVMHYLTAEWWATGTVHTAEAAAIFEQVILPGDGKRSLADADWLMERYVLHYKGWKEEGWKVDPAHAAEVSLHATLKVPSVGPVEVWGTPDQFLLDPDGKRWLREAKTMADWRRLDVVDVTPQETLYTWLARMNGIPVQGVLFDAIKSYRWTRDKHPAADSFQMVSLYRDQDQIDGALSWATALLQRRSHLHPQVTAFSPFAPIKNISQQSCGNCGYQASCWTALSFPHDIEIVGDDD